MDKEDRAGHHYHTEIQTATLAVLTAAAAYVADGAVIAVPTDTVYGVVCRFDSTQAIEQLYWVKERLPQKALPVLLGDEAQLDLVVQSPLPALARPLIRRFWPGPLTLVLPALPHLPPVLTAGGRTVAVRLPDHPFLRALARQAGPLASSSANRSGYANCRTAAEVLAQLAGRIPLIVDGGETLYAAPSTVLDLTGAAPQILRAGPMDAQIRAVLEQNA